MLVIKSKQPIFTDWKSVQHNDWLYQYNNDNYRLIADQPYDVEKHPDIKTLQIDNDAYILIGAFTPLDLIKSKYLRGRIIKLADGNDWYFRTIADVNYKITLGFIDGQPTERLEACDPLFDYLLQKADELRDGADLAQQIDIAATVLSTQYYINRNIALALGLFTTENLEEIIRTIYLIDELRDDKFFRKSDNAI